MQSRYVLASLLVMTLGCRSNEGKAPDVEVVAPDVEENTAAFAPQRELDLYGNELLEHATGRLGSLRMMDRSIRNMIFSASGGQVISTHRDGFQLWDLGDASRVAILEHDAPGDLMAASPDGDKLATSIDDSGDLVFWDLESGKGVGTLKTGSKLIGICYLSDSTFLTASNTGDLSTWNLTTKDGERKSYDGPWSKPKAMACSPEGQWAAVGTEDGDVFLLKVGSDTPVKLGELAKEVSTIVFSRDGKKVAVAGDEDHIYVWNTEAPGKPVRFRAHDRLVTSLAFSPDGNSLYSAGGDFWFRSWNPKSGKIQREFLGAVGLDSQLMSLSPDGNLMISWSQHGRERGSEAGRWWLWNTVSGMGLLEPKRHTEPLRSVSFSPDGTKLVTTGEDKSVRVWKLKSTTSVKILQEAQGAIHDAQWSADGKLLYSAGVDALLNRWDWQGDSEKTAVEGVGGAVNRFVLTSDGSRAITGDQIGRVWSWDLRTGNRIQAYDKRGYSAIYDLAISKDDRLLAIAGSDAMIRVTDLTTGGEIAQLNPGRSSSNYAVSFSPDGTMLATGGDGHKIQIWSTSDWTRLRTLDGHDGTVRCLVFSPDGTKLVSGGNDE
ncbi:MAG: hypothetical protein JKY56_09525, partial [Kofleriaceae bacterium]|nr:hypothetical protein [Kofleriaceae bacterium]